MESIARLMKEEHNKLNGLLNNFILEFKRDNVKAGMELEKFKWALEKHFFIEERAVYELFQSIKGEEVSEIFDMMKDHGEITSLLKEIETDLRNEVKDKSEVLRSLIMKHEHYEDDYFYPLLDEDLNENQRRLIIEKIKKNLEK